MAPAAERGGGGAGVEQVSEPFAPTPKREMVPEPAFAAYAKRPSFEAFVTRRPPRLRDCG